MDFLTSIIIIIIIYLTSIIIIIIIIIIINHAKQSKPKQDKHSITWNIKILKYWNVIYI